MNNKRKYSFLQGVGIFLLFYLLFFTPSIVKAVDNKKFDLLDIISQIRGEPLNINQNLPQHQPYVQPFSIPLETTPFWTSDAIGYSLWGAYLADITGDGYPEIIIISEQSPNYLFKNQNGTFRTSPDWESSDSDFHVSAAFGDYDNDGDLDMAVADYSYFGGRSRLYRNDNGTLTADAVWIASTGGFWCGWGDVDNDGDLDLAMVDLFGYPSLYKNNNGMLETTPSWQAIDCNFDVCGAWIDADNDGDLDLAVADINWQYPVLRIYFNNNGILEQIASWSSQLDPNNYCGSCLAAGDINKNGTIDLAATMGWLESHENCIYGNFNYHIPTWYSDDFYPSAGCVLGDINGDGWLDWAYNNICETGVGYPAMVYENTNGIMNGTPAWASNVPTSAGMGIDLGDVDRDGIRYKEDTIYAPGTRKLFYLSILPIDKIEQITINGDTVPLNGYCCDLKAGWISFRDSIPQGAQIIIKYHYSIDLELLISDYNNNRAYLFRNTNIGGINEKFRTLVSNFQCYPVPVRDGRITLSFVMRDSGRLRLSIYDTSGRKITELFNGVVNTGIYKEAIATDLPPGVYFLRCETNKESINNKIVVVR
jgi:hypothetical protein